MKKIFKEYFPAFVLVLTTIEAVYSVMQNEHSLALFCIANMLFWFTEILMRNERVGKDEDESKT